MDPKQMDVIGEDVDRVARRWAKPRSWHGRGNREWLVSADAAAPIAAWKRHVSPSDTLYLARAANAGAPGATYGAAVRVHTEGTRKAFLWVGARGHVAALLNGEKVMEEENNTTYRFGQFQAPVELRSGENLLVFRAQAPTEPPQISAILVGPRNDGDTLEGIRWSA
jgi:hypothetical protein